MEMLYQDNQFIKVQDLSFVGVLTILKSQKQHYKQFLSVLYTI